jgi:nitrate reductase (NAD(P)H)
LPEGITPILQIIRAALSDIETEDTRIWLLYANRTADDILCREELESFSSERFSYHYTVTTAPPQWEYSVGYITDEMMVERLPPPSDDSLILACGPEPMIKFAVKPNLARLGWDIAKSLIVF